MGDDGFELYYHRERLHVLSDPLHPGRAKHLGDLDAALAELHHKERCVLSARHNDLEDHYKEFLVSEPVETDGQEVVINATRVVVAIDPVGTKLRDDAISCEVISLASSKSVIAVTSYTPNFVDTAIASGKLTSETLQRAYALYESHYIHSPERLWGRWAQNISSLSTTKTIVNRYE